MKLGVALSGGGIRGIAHAGVLKALEDNGIKIDIIGRNKFWKHDSNALCFWLFTISYLYII